MSEDLIRRSDAIKAIEELPNAYNGWSDAYDKAYIIGTLEEVPSADRPQGEWIDNGDRYFRCSLCGTKDTDKWHWCHGCGAKMKGADYDRIRISRKVNGVSRLQEMAGCK